MKDFVKNVNEKVYETNEKGELKQNVRNAFKTDLTNAFHEFLKVNGFQVKMVSDGVAMEIENKELGSICVVADFTVKSRDYDIVSENEAYVQKVSERIAKEQKAFDEKQAKIAKANAERELKAKAKTETVSK